MRRAHWLLTTLCVACLLVFGSALPVSSQQGYHDIQEFGNWISTYYKGPEREAVQLVAQDMTRSVTICVDTLPGGDPEITLLVTLPSHLLPQVPQMQQLPQMPQSHGDILYYNGGIQIDNRAAIPALFAGVVVAEENRLGLRYTAPPDSFQAMLYSGKLLKVFVEAPTGGSMRYVFSLTGFAAACHHNMQLRARYLGG